MLTDVQNGRTAVKPIFMQGRDSSTVRDSYHHTPYGLVCHWVLKSEMAEPMHNRRSRGLLCDLSRCAKDAGTALRSSMREALESG